MQKLRVFAILVALCPVPVSAQLMNVKIIQRQNGETQYTYQVAGHTTASDSGNANCYGSGNTVNCNSSGSSNTTTTVPQLISYSVAGATYSLLLPDGRVAVVNCTSKFAEHFAGPAGNRRSCRMPLIDVIQADFKGKNAKLIWPVSLDGKKTESETYTILGILPAS